MSIASTIAELRTLLDERLAPHAFAREEEGTWVRRWGWKEDVVEVRGVHAGVLVNLACCLPCYDLPGEIGYETLDHQALGPLVGEAGQAIASGGWFGRRRVLRKVESGLPAAFAWFERFETPVRCLESLQRRTISPRSEAYRAMDVFLSAVLAELYSVARTVVPPKGWTRVD